jgi:hypothetical protein
MSQETVVQALSSFTVSNAAPDIYWKKVVYSSSAHRYVAASGSGAMAYSADGQLWTTVSLGGDSWMDVVWNENLNKFIACNYNYKVSTSTDGITWNTSANIDTSGNNLRALAYNSSKVVMLADKISVVSSDMVTWTKGGNLSAGAYPYALACCWSQQLGLFCAIGSVSGYPYGFISTSPDGLTWTERTFPAGGVSDIAWSQPLGMFAVVCNHDIYGSSVRTSPDGITWTNRGTADGFSKIIWSSECAAFVAVGPYKVSYSFDGLTWETRPTPGVNSWYGICWNPDASLLGGAFLITPNSGAYTALSGDVPLEWRLPAGASTHVRGVIISEDNVDPTTIAEVLTYEGETMPDGSIIRKTQGTAPRDDDQKFLKTPGGWKPIPITPPAEWNWSSTGVNAWALMQAL